jgi:hypothetical protein
VGSTKAKRAAKTATTTAAVAAGPTGDAAAADERAAADKASGGHGEGGGRGGKGGKKDAAHAALLAPPATPAARGRSGKKGLRWWHAVDEMDPISLEPIADLAYPPFELAIAPAAGVPAAGGQLDSIAPTGEQEKGNKVYQKRSVIVKENVDLHSFIPQALNMFQQNKPSDII